MDVRRIFGPKTYSLGFFFVLDNQGVPNLSGNTRFSIFDKCFTIRDRKGTPKNFCDKDFAELSDEFPGAICLKTLVLLGNDR